MKCVTHNDKPKTSLKYHSCQQDLTGCLSMQSFYSFTWGNCSTDFYRNYTNMCTDMHTPTHPRPHTYTQQHQQTSQHVTGCCGDQLATITLLNEEGLTKSNHTASANSAQLMVVQSSTRIILWIYRDVDLFVNDRRGWAQMYRKGCTAPVAYLNVMLCICDDMYFAHCKTAGWEWHCLQTC